MSEFRVLLSGRSPHWRESLAAALKNNGFFEVIRAVSVTELVETASLLYPDVVVWKLEDENPFSIISELHVKCPFTLPVLLVEDPKDYDLFSLLRVGVRGCLPVRLLPRQLILALELIVKAGVLCIPRLWPDFFVNREERFTADFSPLTGREREVLSLLKNNLSNQEIARKLVLSESTVKTHIKNVFQKLGVKNRSEARALAFSLRLADESESRPL
ncbi:MAG: response regulator transcription factor [Bacillota bacterium]